MEIKLLDPRLKDNLPHYATDGSAGMDLRVAIVKPYVLGAGETAMLPSGIAIHIDDPCLAGFIYPRSGLGAKHGVVLSNLVGVIDSDYQGEIGLSLWNRSNQDYILKPLERVAQLVIQPVRRFPLEVVKEFSHSTDRGKGGYGSTGK